MVKLINADCMDIMKTYTDNYFDLAIVDPPYRNTNQPDQWLRANNGDMKKWEPAPKKEYFDELFRVSKNQIIWGGNYFTNHLEPNNNWIIWHKLNDGVHFSMCEMAWNSIRKNIKLFKLLPPKDKIHPTQKPIQLYKWLLDKYSEKGQKILDTHLGSGSSAIASHYFGVGEFVGIEIDKEYFDKATKRIEDQTKQLTIF